MLALRFKKSERKAEKKTFPQGRTILTPYPQNIPSVPFQMLCSQNSENNLHIPLSELAGQKTDASVCVTNATSFIGPLPHPTSNAMGEDLGQN